jgi:hypothetical protein
MDDNNWPRVSHLITDDGVVPIILGGPVPAPEDSGEDCCDDPFCEWPEFYASDFDLAPSVN